MVTIVMGGQFGSEGKGSVSSWLAQREKWDLVIRTGGANAGHTFKDLNGVTYKMQQLPVTWAFQNSPIYIPAGAVLDLEIFERECALIRKKGYKGMISVSPSCPIVSTEALQREKKLIHGTTGKGVGATRAAKAMRSAFLWGNRTNSIELRLLQDLKNDRRSNVFIESTQGFGLSLDYKHYPFCTSSNLNVHRILDEAEIPFGVHKIGVWMVIRTFPIRIAGHSGELKCEQSWNELKRLYGDHIPEEQTTVTKKTRRVGLFDPELVRDAIAVNHPTYVVLTFVDYLFPSIKETGVTQEVDAYVSHLEKSIGRGIDYLGVGVGEIIRRKRNGKEGL